MPSATINYTALMNTVKLSKSQVGVIAYRHVQSKASHVEFEIVYTLPYLLPNYLENVYTIEAQVLSKNRTVLAASNYTYTNDLRFAINAVLTYTFLYPLVAFGVVRNGEVRRMPCFVQEDFVVSSSSLSCLASAERDRVHPRHSQQPERHSDGLPPRHARRDWRVPLLSAESPRAGWDAVCGSDGEKEERGADA